MSYLPRVGSDETHHGHESMLRDYIELPLPVRILCLGSLVNRAGSFVLIFLTIYASEEMGFGVGFATAVILYLIIYRSITERVDSACNDNIEAADPIHSQVVSPQ